MQSTSYILNTLHRGRMIQILLGVLFAVGFLVARLPVIEVVKIIFVLFSLPGILFVSIRFSQQSSTWKISNSSMITEKGKKNYQIRLDNIDYVRNHVRSGGNLIAIYQKSGKSPLRFWRNKLFQSNDDFDALMLHIRSLDVPYFVG